MVKAAVLGAAGGIGQPLSLLLASNPHVTDLAAFDVVNAYGVGADLSHLDTPATVTGYLKENDGLKKALTGAELIIIPAGVPRKPGMTRDDLFKINGGIAKDLATNIADFAPNAFVLVISNPVNSLVPVFAEIFKQKGTFNPKRLFGVTTLDIVRASKFLATVSGEPNAAPKYTVPVVGGHSGKTIIPLLSQAKPQPPKALSQEDTDALVNRIQFGGDEVVKAKDGAGSATLSMAYAGAKFASAVLDAAFGGKAGLVVPSYVNLAADPEATKQIQQEIGKPLEYFSVPVQLGPEGVQKLNPLGSITDYEKKLLAEAIPELEANIAKGVDFVTKANL